jgi:hypothetical protein
MNGIDDAFTANFSGKVDRHMPIVGTAGMIRRILLRGHNGT